MDVPLALKYWAQVAYHQIYFDGNAVILCVHYLRALDESDEQVVTYLSGMRQMARERSLRALDIGDALWQDVDTPEALAHAEIMFDGHFRHEPITESLTCV